MTVDLRCARCGSERSPAQRFCGTCGSGLPWVCAKCGEQSPPDFRFCGGCGAPLEGPAPEPAPVEERRTATVLFADLSGFTALSERTDPEDVREVVDRSLGRLGEIVEQFGGSVSQVMGDGMMVLFGAPVAHEDDPERAVRAALEMQRCAAEETDLFGGLPLRVGVNTGEVIFAPLGPRGRREVTALGDAANIASRLQTSAPRGRILVGDRTYDATNHAIRYEAVPPLHVKGKRRPLRAWLALDAIGSPRARPLSNVPMVGREHETDMLQAIWSRVLKEKRAHLVTVLGSPGIGKTRLSREFTRYLETQGGRAVHGRSLPYGERTGYGAFAQQVKHVCGIFETDPAPTARDKLDSAVRSLVPEDPEEVAAGLAVLVGLEEAHIGDRSPLLVSARRFVEAVAHRAPTTFVFEDIHWGDTSLCELIEYLAARVRGAPALLFTLARPELLEDRPHWGGGLTAYTAVPLEPLSDDDCLTLAARLLPDMSERGVMVARLADAAGGNPLFLEELAASIAEGATGRDQIPPGITAIIASRIDALPVPERRIVRHASVVGKIFWRGALTGESDVQLDAVLSALEYRDLIRREPASRIAGDEEFSFKHMLIREVAYSTLSRAIRRERHAAVAGFIEGAASDRVAEWASLLAHHWREAGDDTRAVEYLLLAADTASRGWAKGEAVSQYSAALELIPDSDHDRRQAIRLKRAFALVDAGDFRTALPELDELMPELEGRDLIEALLGGGRAAFWLMEAEWVSKAGQRALELTASTAEGDLHAPALALVARSRSMVQRVSESAALGEEALAEWSEDTHTADLAFHLGQMATELVWIGRFERAVELARRGFDLAMDRQIVEAVFAGSALGMALTAMGRHEEAIMQLERVEALGRDVEMYAPRFTARTLSILAGALREIHDFEAARRLNEEAVELGARAGFLHPVIQGGIDLLYLDLASDDVGSAQRAWPVLWEKAQQELGNFYPWLVRGRLAQARADIALAAGDLDDVPPAATDAIERARRPGRTKYEVLGRITMGRALHGLDRAEEAVTQERLAYDAALTLGHPPTLWQAASALTTALYRLGDDAGASSVHQTVRGTIDAFARSLSDERRSRFLADSRIAEMLSGRTR